jgi:hypothetical protein
MLAETRTEVSKKMFTSLGFYGRGDSFLSHFIDNISPCFARFQRPQMNPKTVLLHHRRPFFCSPQKNAIRLLNRFQLSVRTKPKPFSQRFGDNDSASLINSDFDSAGHTIDNTIYHFMWQPAWHSVLT